MSKKNTVESTELITTVDQWKEAMLKARCSLSDTGLTTSELAKELNVSKTTIHRSIERLLEIKKCRVGYSMRIDKAGNKRLVPVYDLIKEKK